MTDHNSTDLELALELADPGDRLVAVRSVEIHLADRADKARQARRDVIAELRARGLTWRVIGDLLGVSPQAAEQLAGPNNKG